VSETSTSVEEVSLRGGAPSLIENFGITGLYGYRSISLSSKFAATILIARNGSGKTTLLGVLDAFLRCQFSRLRDLEFSEIFCKLRDQKRELRLTQNDVAQFSEILPDSELSQLARSIDVAPSLLFTFITEEFDYLRADFPALQDNQIFTAIRRHTSYRFSDAIATCDKLRVGLYGKNKTIRQLSAVLQSTLSDIDIVYLPTYRRIELPMVSDQKEAIPRKRRQSRIRQSAISLFTGDIQFGLADISERLSELNQIILSESNFGYRRISANMINELIDGTYEHEIALIKDIPDKSELSLFFSRLQEGDSRYGSFADISIPNIDKIYTGVNVSFESSKFLRYFLSKLDTVIKATRDIELTVQQFIDSCNKYLCFEDSSVSPPNQSDPTGRGSHLDDKVLVLNRQNLRVHVESQPGGRKISLDALSSGEKQMVSLFAKLFLYPKSKIVLIDEPELSLSIEWQRHILVDVVNARQCRQVIAITHSPFVFDNTLEPFAQSLTIGVSPNASQLAANDDQVDI